MGIKFKWKPKEKSFKQLLLSFKKPRKKVKESTKKNNKDKKGLLKSIKNNKLKNIKLRNPEFKNTKLKTEGMSIRYKLLFSVTALIVCAMLITSTIVYINSSITIFTQSKEEMKSLVTRSIETISVMMEKNVSEAYALANTKESNEILKNIDSKDANLINNNTGLININNKFFKEYKSANPHVDRVSLVDISGNIISDSEETLVGSNVSDTQYHATSASGGNSISDTLQAVDGKKSVIVFTYPVLNKEAHGKSVGYVALHVYSNSFSKYLNKIKINNTESSFAYLADEDGKIIYHPNTEKIGQKVDSKEIGDIIAKVMKGSKVETSAIEYNYESKKILSAYGVTPKTNWLLVVNADRDEIRKPVQAMTKVIIIVAVLVIVGGILLTLIMANIIVKPIIGVTYLVNKTSQLDLTDDDINSSVKSKDEIGLIWTSIINMRTALREVVQELMDAGETLTRNANLVEESTEVLKYEADETLIETENISSGIQQTAATAEEITASSDDMLNRVNKISEGASSGNEITEEILSRAEEVKEVSLKSKEKTEEVYSQVKAELESAINGSKEVNQIHKLANSILEITEQTNLLALNAAIEAARAGDAGRGFAVVADEVRKLAEQSGKTASDIQQVVRIVHNSVENLALGSEKMIKFMELNVSEDYERTIKVGEQYSNDAEKFNKFMTQFNEESQALNSSIGDIVRALEEVSTTVSEGALGVSNVTNKTTDIVSKIDEIKNTSVENKNSAEKISDITSKFKL